MNFFGIVGTPLKWIESFLTEVVIGTSTSKAEPLKYDVSQGSYADSVVFIRPSKIYGGRAVGQSS